MRKWFGVETSFQLIHDRIGHQSFQQMTAQLSMKAALPLAESLATASYRSSNTWPWSWSWWHHQMETFSALLAICAGNSPVTGEFPAQRSVTRSFDVFIDLRLNKWLSTQSWGWWFETLSRPLWRHCNGDHCREVGGPHLQHPGHPRYALGRLRPHRQPGLGDGGPGGPERMWRHRLPTGARRIH